MPLIWDDFSWLWVRDGGSYNKIRFVAVRKLRVKPTTSQNVAHQKFSVENVRRQLRKLSIIESIEPLPNNEAGVYVTLVNSRYAYNVQYHYQRNEMGKFVGEYSVEPADTWEQPPETSKQQPKDDMKVDEEQTPEIFNLNEDCLLHLFKFLDIDSLANMAFVCQLFHGLLHQHRFPRIRKYEVSCDPEFVLAQTRRVLLCIGQHITDLTFRAHYSWKKKGDWSSSWSDDNERTSKFFSLVVQHVGQNVRRAFLEFVLNEARIRTIAPMLLNLESLEIADKSNTPTSGIDFPLLCPNLVEFKSNSNVPMAGCCKPWPSLRHLSMKMNSGTVAILNQVIQENHQLTDLELLYDNDFYCVPYTEITQHLTNLEKLTIHLENVTGYFTRLGQLPHLREINLNSVQGHSLNSVINHLPMFANLQKITLFSNIQDPGTRDYGQPLVEMARSLTNLEELELHRIPMEPESLLDIVRFGYQLKVLKIYNCKLVFTEELISKLADACKCYHPESDEPLQLNLDKAELFGNFSRD